MRIHTIDMACPSSPLIATQSGYFFRVPLDQCDTVLWNPDDLRSQLVSEGMELSVAASTEMFIATRHWRAQFERLWQRGGTLVVLLPESAMVQAHHFEDLIDLNVLDALGTDVPQPEPTNCGTADITCGGQPFHDFFASTTGVWAPASMLQHPIGTAVLHGAQGQTLASYQNRGAGRLLLLPQMRTSLSASERESFLQAVSLLIAKLSDPALIVNAGWLDNLDRPVARARELAIEGHKAQMRALQQQIDTLETQSRASAFDAQIVAGTGRGVYRAVLSALARAGVSAERDWLDESIILVFDVTGLIVLRVVLFGEVIDESLMRKMVDEVDRIEVERGPAERVVVIDCRENILSLEQRGTTRVEMADLRGVHGAVRGGWSLISSKALYGLLSNCAEKPVCGLSSISC